VVNPGLTLPGLLPGLIVKPPDTGTPPAGGATVNPQFVLPPGALKLQPGTVTPAPPAEPETPVDPLLVPQLQLQAPIPMAPVTPAQ
jgi:hypothetical protein